MVDYKTKKMASHVHLCAYVGLVRKQTGLSDFGQGNGLRWLCKIDIAERSVSGF